MTDWTQAPEGHAAPYSADLIERARLSARRLRAAGRQPGFYGRRSRELGQWLGRARRMNELPVIMGYNAHLSALASFLRDYGAAIDLECRMSAQRARMERACEAYAQTAPMWSDAA